MTFLEGLAGAEQRERAAAAAEERAWAKVLAYAREELPNDELPISLETYLFAVARAAGVDLLDAKRALSALRSRGEASYKFGIGVTRIVDKS